MTGEIYQIYSVQITGKCICETFPPPLRELIISPHVKDSPEICPKKFVPLCKAFLRKTSHYAFFRGGGDTLLYLHIFSDF